MSPTVPYLQLLVKQKGSDLHIGASSAPMIRIRGDLVKIEAPPLTAQDMERMVAEITNPHQKTEISQQKTSTSPSRSVASACSA